MLKSVGVEEKKFEEKRKTHLLLVVVSLSLTEFVVSFTESRVYPRSSYFNNNDLFLPNSFDSGLAFKKHDHFKHKDEQAS